MAKIDVAVLTGSLRQASYTRKMGRAAAKLSPAGMNLSMVEIGDLPLYNEDLESNPPDAYTRFRGAIGAADAILFVTPEFNRGMPGALKNAIDVGSRPWGKSIWNGKPAAVISMSPGALGGFGANHQLRQALVAVNVATMAHPEAYIGGIVPMFDEAGELTDANTREFVSSFLGSFRTWIERFVGSR